MNKHRIIFFGTPEFAVPSLQILIDSGSLARLGINQSPIAVVTEPDRPAGRGKKLKYSSVKELAQKNNLQIYQPEKISTLSSQLSALEPDVAIVVAYGQIIPKEILEIPKFGFINLHPSLLPKYRGPSPIQAAILNGDKVTGVTIIKLDEKMDHGPILAQQELEIANSKKQKTNKIQIPIDYENLSKELAKLGAELLIKTLPDYLNNKIKPINQDHTKATFTKLINKSDGLINWSEPVDLIERKIRAYNPWPGAYTFINNKRLKICQAHIKYDKLIIDLVQLEGKKIITWSEFIRGHKDIINLLDEKILI
ncbi:MAG: hypothetical protein ACD_58C00304G0012 [uncultured bacterium]|nr:MAG: hypothetical protein ACD_58C00304G0012 [uncultured bacterium]